MRINYGLSDIDEAAKLFWEIASESPVIVFKGGLGAGKTTFTAALCKYLGVEDMVSSPTFSLINHYRFNDANGQSRSIYHSDWYRLSDEEEAWNAGVADMLNQRDGWCIIEWPEKAEGLLPKHYLEVCFELNEDQSRSLVVEKR